MRLEAGHTMNLQDQVKMWATPISRDWKDGDTTTQNVPENGILGRQAANWSTPRASDGEKGAPNQSFGGGSVPLAAQTQNWNTPSVADTEGGRTSRSGDRIGEPLLNTQAEQVSLRSILLDQPISTVGEESSKIRRSLSPLFVEWLMGWPRGWTSLVLTPPGSSACACSETELYHFKQRMRFALWQLALPEDQPVQQSLFV